MPCEVLGTVVAPRERDVAHADFFIASITETSGDTDTLSTCLPKQSKLLEVKLNQKKWL